MLLLHLDLRKRELVGLLDKCMWFTWFNKLKHNERLLIFLF